MPRYELVEGSSNKFWEITLKGKSFTTRYGRIGSDGQETTKSFGSPADAQREHDKLVAEKVKKGYHLAGGKAPADKAPAAKAAAGKATTPAAGKRELPRDELDIIAALRGKGPVKARAKAAGLAAKKHSPETLEALLFALGDEDNWIAAESAVESRSGDPVFPEAFCSFLAAELKKVGTKGEVSDRLRRNFAMAESGSFNFLPHAATAELIRETARSHPNADLKMFARDALVARRDPDTCKQLLERIDAGDPFKSAEDAEVAARACGSLLPPGKARSKVKKLVAAQPAKREKIFANCDSLAEEIWQEFLKPYNVEDIEIAGEIVGWVLGADEAERKALTTALEKFDQWEKLFRTVDAPTVDKLIKLDLAFESDDVSQRIAQVLMKVREPGLLTKVLGLLEHERSWLFFTHRMTILEGLIPKVAAATLAPLLTKAMPGINMDVICWADLAKLLIESKKRDWKPVLDLIAAKVDALSEDDIGESNTKRLLALEGETFTTRWGRDAKQAVEAKATKKTAAKTASKAAAAVTQAVTRSNPKLEAAIEASPDDPAPYLVYADWLTSQGDPRGELIVVQHALQSASGAKAKELKAREQALLTAHAAAWLGDVAEAEKSIFEFEDDKGKTAKRARASLEWRYGFVKAATIAGQLHEEERVFAAEDQLATLLDSPVGRFIEELSFGVVESWTNRYEKVQAVLVKKKPKTVRRLSLCDVSGDQCAMMCSVIDDMRGLNAALPNLEKLHLYGAMPDDLAKMDFPELRDLAVRTGGLGAKVFKGIISSSLSKLERLEIWFGHHSYGGECTVKDLEPLFAGTGLAKVKHLGLMNAEFTDDIVQGLVGSTILKQLETLNLSMGCLTDAGVEVLKANGAAFKHLKHLDVSDNAVEHEAALKGIKDLCASVSYKNQSPDRVEDPENRYPAVGE